MRVARSSRRIVAVAASAPTIARPTDVRPAPTRPASPTNLAATNRQRDIAAAHRPTVSPRTSSAGAPGVTVRSGNSSAISRPTIARMSCARSAAAASTVVTCRPSLSTVTRSATAKISSNRCEMKTMPSAARAKLTHDVEQSIDLAARKTRRRLVENQHPRVLLERARDLDHLLLRNAELPHGRGHVHIHAEIAGGARAPRPPWIDGAATTRRARVRERCCR